MYFFCWGTYLFISINRNSLSIKDITFYLKFVLHSFSSSNLSFTFKVPLEVELLNIYVQIYQLFLLWFMHLLMCLQYCQDFLTKNFYKFLLNSLTHTLNKYLLDASCMPGIVLSTEASSKA